MISELAFEGGRLRAWHEADADRLVEAWADEDIARWNPVPPEPTLTTAIGWINGVAERAARRMSFDWVIESFEVGDVVGEVGLSGFSERHKGALIGYWLLPTGRGQGLATQAVSAATKWAHRALDLDVIVARCHQSNSASQAVAARAGYTRDPTNRENYQVWRSRSSGV